MTLELRKLTHQDISLFEQWLGTPHVAKWYHDPQDWLLEVKEREQTFSFLHHLIVVHNGEAIGFCQYYLFSESGEDWHGTWLLDGTYSIDYMIGEKAYVGKGFGKRIIKQLTEHIMALPDCQRIIVQPEPENLASCGALLSVGYRFDEENELYILKK